MKANYSKEFNRTFIVGEDRISKMYKLLVEKIGETRIKVDCTDDITRTFTTLAELLEFENSSAKEITTLTLESSPEVKFFSPDVRIRFRSKGYFRGISIDIDAHDDETISFLVSTLNDILDGTKPWYHPITTVNIFYSIFAIYLFIFLAFLIYAAFLLPEPIVPTESQTSPDLRKDAKLWLIAIGFLLTNLGVGYLFSRFIDKFFPFGTFLVGQGISRHDSLEKIRWGVIVAAIISLGIGLIILLITLLFN